MQPIHLRRVTAPETRRCPARQQCARSGSGQRRRAGGPPAERPRQDEKHQRSTVIQHGQSRPTWSRPRDEPGGTAVSLVPRGMQRTPSLSVLHAVCRYRLQSWRGPCGKNGAVAALWRLGGGEATNAHVACAIVRPEPDSTRLNHTDGVRERPVIPSRRPVTAGLSRMGLVLTGWSRTVLDREFQQSGHSSRPLGQSRAAAGAAGPPPWLAATGSVDKIAGLRAKTSPLPYNCISGINK